MHLPLYMSHNRLGLEGESHGLQGLDNQMQCKPHLDYYLSFSSYARRIEYNNPIMDSITMANNHNASTRTTPTCSQCNWRFNILLVRHVTLRFVTTSSLHIPTINIQSNVSVTVGNAQTPLATHTHVGDLPETTNDGALLPSHNVTTLKIV